MQLYVTIKDLALGMGNYTKDKEYFVTGISGYDNFAMYRITDDVGDSDWVGKYMVKEVVKKKSRWENV